jgi:translation initiation factor IF-2
VQVLGFDDVPIAGSTFRSSPTSARRATWHERQAERRAAATPAPAVTLEKHLRGAQSRPDKELNLILKADVQGSIEPIVNSLEKLGDEKLKVKILHQGTGNITESDVMLAIASGAIILGFSVMWTPRLRARRRTKASTSAMYNIIYKLIEDVQKALTGLLEPVFKEVITGHAEVRQVFKVTKIGKMAGSYITRRRDPAQPSGRLKRGGNVLARTRSRACGASQEDVPK